MHVCVLALMMIRMLQWPQQAYRYWKSKRSHSLTNQPSISESSWATSYNSQDSSIYYLMIKTTVKSILDSPLLRGIVTLSINTLSTVHPSCYKPLCLGMWISNSCSWLSYTFIIPRSSNIHKYLNSLNTSSPPLKSINGF